MVLADYVTTDDGTGLVHQAPAFGAEDLAVCRAYGLPVVNPVRPDGHFEESVPLVGGEFFKNADKALVQDLDETGLLFRHQAYEHAYPHCWRCHTALLYYALPSWYIRTTAGQGRAARRERAHQLVPGQHQVGPLRRLAAQQHRLGAVPRRATGAPRCRSGGARPTTRRTWSASGRWPSSASWPGRTCPRSTRTGRTSTTSRCPAPSARRARGTMRRVPEVIDAWYDSGSMPFAQWGYPHAAGSVEQFEQAFPAQFICEAIDQTRGWFYTLMAVGTLVFGRSSYENVLCLGHILAEDGRKMSKHLGNILEPMPLMEEHGADALRWFMAASGSPWLPRRVGHAALQEIVRKMLLTYWNTASFLTLYANANDWSPLETPAPDVADRPVLDRWALSETHRLVHEVTAAFEAFDTPRAGRLLAELRRRPVQLVRPPVAPPVLGRRPGGAGHAARVPATSLTLLLAPLVPFVTERVWQDVVRPVWPDAPDSVHLAAWPQVDGAAGRRRAGRADGAGPPAGRARPVGPGRVQGPQPAAAGPGAGRRPRLGRAARRAAPPGRRRAQRARLRASWPASWSTAAPRATSGRSASGSARTPRRSPPPIAAADAAALAAALRGTGRRPRSSSTARTSR